MSEGELLKKRLGLVVLGVFVVVVLCGISGVVGGALSHHFGTSNYTISYADFVSVMLTAISVLLTGLTIFLGVLGVLGWAAISNGVHRRTEQFLEEGFKEGNPLFSLVESRVAAVVYKGIGGIDDNDDPPEGEGAGE